jgi:hypothetical protein
MKKLTYIFFLSFMIIAGCTDLNVDVYSDITSENFFLTEEQVLSAAGPAYTSLKGVAVPENMWGMTELTTDEFLIPTRGSDWYNDGIYQRFHRHTWYATDFIFNNTWSVLYEGVANCNRVIFQYNQVEEQSDALISVSNELKALRALYYFFVLDLWGNAPLVDRYDVPEDFAPEITPRGEIFEFIDSSLTAAVDVLNPEKNTETYGRFHRWAAYTLLAKIYLNAEVYIGQPMYGKCIAMCDSVIASGLYSIEDDYFSNFLANNESSDENIFVVPYDNLGDIDWARIFNIHLWTLHGSNRETFDIEQSPWNGVCGVPSFVRSYDTDDLRLNAWLTGQQFSATGDSLFCTKGEAGQPLNFTIDFDDMEYATEYDGARIAKYEYDGAVNYQMPNDYVVFRYADVLLMKAEALMRQNGGAATAEAVNLVNQVRARAFDGDESKYHTTATLTLDALLAERGWELCSEGWRRNDLIRFGKYNDPSDFRPEPAPDYCNLFPIPQDQINANPNLAQNPGYTQ